MQYTYTVLLFGIAKDIVGSSSWQLCTIAQTLTSQALIHHLITEFPALATVQSLIVAANNNYTEPTDELHPTDEIALIPPVSGG